MPKGHNGNGGGNHNNGGGNAGGGGGGNGGGNHNNGGGGGGGNHNNGGGGGGGGNHNNGGGNNNHNGNGGGASEGGTGPLHAAIGGGNVAGGGGNGNRHRNNGQRGGNGQGGGADEDFDENFGDDFGPDEEGAIGFEDPDSEDFGPDSPGEESSDQDFGNTGGGVGATDGGTAPPAPSNPASDSDFVSDSGGQYDSGMDLSSSEGGDFGGGYDAGADSEFSGDMGSGGTAPTYIVAPGDTLSGIAEQNGISLADLEAMNPQIKNPDLIFPGQTVTIGAPVEEGAGISDGEFMGDEFSDIEGGGIVVDPESEAGGFPTSSSYPPSENAQAVQKALGNKFKSLGNRLKGWGIGSPPADPARNAMYVSSQRNTDPLNIKNNKDNLDPGN